MDRDTDLFAQGGDELLHRERTAEAGHVLDREDVGAHLLEFLRLGDIIFQRILVAPGIIDIAGVADRRLAEGEGLVADRRHCHGHVGQVVERVEDTEDVHPRVGGVFHESGHDIVGVVRIADRIGTAEEHLETNVRHLLAQVAQSVPRAFLEETHRGVKGRAAPHLEAEKVGRALGHDTRDIEHVDGAHPCCDERLVGIAHRRIGDEERLLLADPGGKFLGTQFEKPGA